MCCAFIFIHFKKHPESITSIPFQNLLSTNRIVILGMLSFGLWAAIVSEQDRMTYLRLHKWTSLLPITTYLVLRNCSPCLRRMCIPPVCWIGRHSLEMYILQFDFFFHGKQHLLWTSQYPLMSMLINFGVTMYVVVRQPISLLNFFNNWIKTAAKMKHTYSVLDEAQTEKNESDKKYSSQHQ